jgi:hypothetical protein
MLLPTFFCYNRWFLTYSLISDLDASGGKASLLRHLWNAAPP